MKCTLLLNIKSLEAGVYCHFCIQMLGTQDSVRSLVSNVSLVLNNQLNLLFFKNKILESIQVFLESWFVWICFCQCLKDLVLFFTVECMHLHQLVNGSLVSRWSSGFYRINWILGLEGGGIRLLLRIVGGISQNGGPCKSLW